MITNMAVLQPPAQTARVARSPAASAYRHTVSPCRLPSAFRSAVIPSQDERCRDHRWAATANVAKSPGTIGEDLSGKHKSCYRPYSDDFSALVQRRIRTVECCEQHRGSVVVSTPRLSRNRLVRSPFPGLR
jgi:hypothetical protein